MNEEFDLSIEPEIDAIFQIDANLEIIGSGLINVTTSGGVATVSSTNYTHEQAVASDTWVIEHNLNKYPSVTIVDTAGTAFTAQVTYNDENTCTVHINGATKGKAYLN